MLLSTFRPDDKPARGGKQDRGRRSLPDFRSLIENSIEAVLILETDKGKVIEANENACLLFQWDHEELTKLNFGKLSNRKQPGGISASKLFAEEKQKALHGLSPIFEWAAATKSGKRVLCEVQLSKLHVREHDLIRANIISIEPRQEALNTQSVFSDGEHTDELAALALAGASIASSLDLNKVLQVVSQQLSSLLDVQVCIISDWQPATKTLAVRLKHGENSLAKIRSH